MLVLCPLTLSPSHPPGSVFFPLASRDPGLILPKQVSFKPQSFWEEEEEVDRPGVHFLWRKSLLQLPSREDVQQRS